MEFEGQAVELTPPPPLDSVLYVEEAPKYVVFNEVILTSEAFMRDVTAIEPEWLTELAPHFYEIRHSTAIAATAAAEDKCSTANELVDNPKKRARIFE